jgi:hypothetical protein
MNQFHVIAKIVLVIWPLWLTVVANFYRRKQNGLNPWTGGQISWPKAFWLAYAIQTWFFLPLFFFQSSTPDFIRYILIFHLISWWLRGLCELVMIYKWFNWTPRYGIGHDLFHLIGCGSLLFYFRDSMGSVAFGTTAFAAYLYILMLFISTSAEITFAMLFMKFRSKEEVENNVYFASDDPKWVFVNRYTLSIVVIVFIHLIFQSFYALKYF